MAPSFHSDTTSRRRHGRRGTKRDTLMCTSSTPSTTVLNGRAPGAVMVTDARLSVVLSAREQHKRPRRRGRGGRNRRSRPHPSQQSDLTAAPARGNTVIVSHGPPAVSSLTERPPVAALKATRHSVSLLQASRPIQAAPAPSGLRSKHEAYSTSQVFPKCEHDRNVSESKSELHCYDCSRSSEARK
jgi:hypothetical protein